MEQQAVFRRQLGGFHKNDVLGYIDSLTQSYVQNKETLTAQTNELAATNAQLTQTLERCEQEKTRLLNEHAQQDQTIRMLNEQLDVLRKEVLQKDEELARSGQTLEDMHKQLAQTQKKSQEYDKAVSQIGATFMQARESARQIVDNANDVAQKLVQSAQEQNKRYHELSQETIEQVNAQVGTCKEEILALKDEIAQTISDITQKLDDLWDSLDGTQTRFSAGVSKQEMPPVPDMQFTRAFDRLTDEQIQCTAREMLKDASELEESQPPSANAAQSSVHIYPLQARARSVHGVRLTPKQSKKHTLGTQFRQIMGGWLK